METITSNTVAFVAASSPPVPTGDALTGFFWDGIDDHRLMILRCQSCGHYVHYPRPICDHCQSTELAPEAVSGRATLYSWTSVRQAFHPYFVDKIPYVLAVVELVEEPGLRLTTNLPGLAEEQIRIGMDLEVFFSQVTDSLTLAMFRPTQTGSEL
jgi:uncharacterized OB-fold protein